MSVSFLNCEFNMYDNNTLIMMLLACLQNVTLIGHLYSLILIFFLLCTVMYELNLKTSLYISAKFASVVGFIS